MAPAALPRQVAASIFADLNTVQWVITDEADQLRMISFKETLNLAEILFLKHWAANESGIMQVLESKQVPFHPSTDELRLLYLFELFSQAKQDRPGITRATQLPGMRS